MLETARDALFLAKVPASRLPWVYLAIAGLSLLVISLQSKVSGKLTGRAALSIRLAFAGIVTLVFWALGGSEGIAGVYALYIWSGVLTMLVLVHFWTLLGDLFNVTQAKRIYALIGSGSVLGAIVGTAAAGALTRVMDPEMLLLASGGGLLVTALMPAFLHSAERHQSPKPQRSASLVEAAAYVARRPYARQVALLMIISAVTVTIADYLFKSTVAAHVAPEDLGGFFAVAYFVFNVASLIIQLTALTWIVRRFDITIALAALPVLLLGGGAIFLATATLTAALIIKGADGSLRYSLHRTATELLFVPMSDSARRRVKSFIDIVGQRGGQTLASLLILSGAALGLGSRTYAIALIVCAGTWVCVAIGLRPYYLDLFRRRLDRGVSSASEFPELDLASLETLIATLDSPDEGAVAAALQMIEREKKVRLIPSLILYHPSHLVLERALAIFGRSGRLSALGLIQRLIKEHPAPEIRSAAVASAAALSASEHFLRMRLSLEESADVRAVIMVNLIATGAIVGPDARDALNAIIESGTTETQVALAHAISRQQGPNFSDVLIMLAASEVGEVRAASAQAMGSLQLDETLPALLQLLTSEDSRSIARESFLRMGPRGLEALSKALRDRDTPRLVRWQLPKSIGAFENDEAADVLLSNLPDEFDGMVRYRSIRTLELIIAAQPMLRLDRVTLRDAIEATVGRCYRYLDRRVSLQHGATESPKRKTPGCTLLLKMLADKEAHAFDRLFRLLNLAHPKDGFLKIYRSLRSDRASARTGSLELIENLIKPPLRAAVVGLVDDIPDEERLNHAGQYHKPLHLSYDDLLVSMIRSSSADVRDITVFHIGELSLVDFEPEVAKLAEDLSHPVSDIDRTLSILRAPAEKGSETDAR
jgi:AAA family ATP:ADP antiporter